MNYFLTRFALIKEAFGLPLFLIGVFVSSVIAKADWIYKQFIEIGWASPSKIEGMIFGFPSWIIGLVVALAFLFFVTLNYAVKIKEKANKSWEEYAYALNLTAIDYPEFTDSNNTLHHSVNFLIKNSFNKPLKYVVTNLQINNSSPKNLLNSGGFITSMGETVFYSGSITHATGNDVPIHIEIQYGPPDIPPIRKKICDIVLSRSGKAWVFKSHNDIKVAS
ncbi:MAG: hypothetical protein IT560_11380 [Alphaproteobacteria bacterium]|nr:hypothetical protein [Alphaproteobacteria bacterium]